MFPLTDWLCSAWVTDDQGDSGSRPSLVACTSTPQPFCSASTFFVRPKNDPSWGGFHCFSRINYLKHGWLQNIFKTNALQSVDHKTVCAVKITVLPKKIIPAECGSQNCVCSQNYCITQKNNSILTTLSSAFTCVSNLILKKPWQLFWLPHWVFHRVADFLKQVSWRLYETRQPPTMSISYRPKPSQKVESLVYYFIFTHQISVTLFSLRPGHGIWELTINSMLIERSCTQLSLSTHHIERQWKLSTKCVKNHCC